MNSAQRLENIFIQLRSTQPPNSAPNTPPTGVDAWASIFGRHGEGGQDLDDIGSECARAVGQELIHLSQLLREHGIPDAIYANHLASLRSITSTRYLHGNWQSMAGMVKEEYLTSLQWAGYLLGSDSSADAEGQVDALAAQIDQLIAEVTGSALPPSLQRFVLRNLRSIRDALWRYKVAGAGPLREAMQGINGTPQSELNSVRSATQDLPEAEAGILQRVGAMITTVANVCDVATKLDGGFELAKTAAKALGYGG
jgi:hypothetical protein